MHSFLKSISILFVIILLSCQDKPSEEAVAFDSKMKETIQIHDDVMPKMSEINSLISQLEAKKAELEEAEELDQEQINLLDLTITNLKEAHDLMMSWMKNFSNTFSRSEINDGLTTTDMDSIKAKLKTLEAQYKSAESMKEAIIQSVENAKTILAE